MLGKHIPWRASKLKFLSKGLASQAVQNFCFNDGFFSLCEKRRGVPVRIDRMTCHFCHYPALFINNILFRGEGGGELIFISVTCSLMKIWLNEWCIINDLEKCKSLKNHQSFSFLQKTLLLPYIFLHLCWENRFSDEQNLLFLCSSGSLKPLHSCRAFCDDFILMSSFNLHLRFNGKFFSLCEKIWGVL